MIVSYLDREFIWFFDFNLIGLRLVELIKFYLDF